MSKKKHAPGPLEVHEGDDYIVIMRPGDTTDTGIRVDNLGDAAFIALACNCHAELLDACREALYWMNCDSRGEEACAKQIAAAIANAEVSDT